MDDLTESKLQNAYTLIKAGQSDQACEILIPLVSANPNLTDGWFLLGHAVSDSQKKIRYFRQVLRLDPANQPAQKQLARLLALQTAEKSASKKQNLVLPWGLAGLAILFISLSGLVFLQGFHNPLFTNLVPVIPGSAASILPIATSVAPTSTPEPGPTPTLVSGPTVKIPLKPTSRPTITMPPTASFQPSVTMIPTITITPTPTKTPKPMGVFTGCLAPNGLGVFTAPFKIENFGKERATVTIKGTSRNGNYTIYCVEIVKQGKPEILTLMWGNYEYAVVRGSTTRNGSFFINQPYKATMRVFEDKIQIGPFP